MKPETGVAVHWPQHFVRFLYCLRNFYTGSGFIMRTDCTDTASAVDAAVDAAIIDSLFSGTRSLFWEPLYQRVILSVRAVTRAVFDKSFTLDEIATVLADADSLSNLMAQDGGSTAVSDARAWYRNEWLRLAPETRASVIQAFGVIKRSSRLVQPKDGGVPVRLGERRGPWSAWSLNGFPDRVRMVAADAAAS